MEFGVAMMVTEGSIAPQALARAVEERGFESLWMPEHSHIPASRLSPWPGGGDLPRPYYEVMDPFVALAAAAAVTKRIKLCTGICLVVQRDPIQLAKEVASLDQISNGRVILGVGGGWNAEEMANHGTAFKTRFKLMAERIAAMRAIWTEDEASFDGEFVSFEGIRAWPKPKQSPHPPIVFGGGFPHGARRAIAQGDGWMPIGGRDLDVLEILPQFRQMAAEADLGPDDMPVTLFGAQAQPDTLARARDAGIARAVFMLPSKDEATILGQLDDLANLAGLGG